MNTIKVKPWGKQQGEFVLINESDFDPSVHVKFDDEAVVEVQKQERKVKNKPQQEA